MKEVQEKLTSSLDDFCSVLGVKELDSFFANYKSSRDNSSKQLAHPCPRSPSGRPSMMQKMLGTAGINIKLAIAAGDSIHSGNKGKSQFTQSVNYQLDCLLNLDLRSIECADKLTFVTLSWFNSLTHSMINEALARMPLHPMAGFIMEGRGSLLILSNTLLPCSYSIMPH